MQERIALEIIKLPVKYVQVSVVQSECRKTHNCKTGPIIFDWVPFCYKGLFSQILLIGVERAPFEVDINNIIKHSQL